MSRWLGKKTQALTETFSKTTEKTEFDEQFVTLEKTTDATRNVLDKITKFMPNYLHPNPAARAKMSMGSTVAKLKKTAAESRYPHTSCELAELFTKSAEELGDTTFSRALAETGDTFAKVCEANHAFDDAVNQEFVEPLRHILDSEVKEVMKHRKKLEGRRLDFDYKRRKIQSGKSSVTEADIKAAEEKFEESRENCINGMIGLQNTEVEQLTQLKAFVQASINFHRSAASTLEELAESLQEAVDVAAAQPKRKVRPMTVHSDDDDDDEPRRPPVAERPPAPNSSNSSNSRQQPYAKALFDFDAENDGELSFKEGDKIILLERLDENWLQGEVRGRSGIFPTNYVQVVVDLP